MEHIPVSTTDHFSEAHLTYIDAALGWPWYSKKAATEVFEMYMPKWLPTGLAYPTRISGDTHSALIAFTDTSELFGGEIRILGAIDFKDGKIVRARRPATVFTPRGARFDLDPHAIGIGTV